MKSFKTELQHVIHVTPSGLDHPYYSVKTTLFSEDMLGRVTSYPALGDDTVIPQGRSDVHFSVFIEAETSCDNWEVQLWHNFTGLEEWSSLSLKRSTNNKLRIDHSGDAQHSQWFCGTLVGKPDPIRPVSFTFRFRTSADAQWKWVRDQSGVEDGRVIFQNSPMVAHAKHELSRYFDDLSSELAVNQVSSEAETTIWSLEAPVASAQGEKSGFSDHTLGVPRNLSRWFSLVRLWSPWLAPRQGRGLPLADKDSIVYSFLRDDGLHVAAIAISGIEDVLTVFRYENDKIVVSGRNDQESKGTARVIVAVGHTFDDALSAVVYEARKLVTRLTSGTVKQSLTRDAPASSGEKGAKTTWATDWIDGFAYCTWNGLGQDLTEEKILGALKSLEDHGIKISNLIIDDNWQDLDNEGQNQFKRGWKDFDANRKGFPGGWRPAIANIRQKYPYLIHIAVWHALFGYWGGISPEGRIAKDYKTIEVKKRDDLVGGKMLVVDSSDVQKFYNDFYSFLSSVGIDSSKTDAQFFLDVVDTAPERRSLIQKYIDTWLEAEQYHFYGHAISCMSQAPQILFRGQLPQWRIAIPVRNSDDFFPDVEESHPWHIFCNAGNALLNRYLNIIPDWDMFQTGHPWAWFHAAARCVSGGPIYITDEPGKHNVELIRQMTASTTQGQTVILRPNCVGRALSPYVGYEEQRLCKIGAYWGYARTGTSFMGVFNCLNIPVTEVVPLSDFMGTEYGDKYVIRSHRKGIMSDPMTVTKEEDAVLCIGLQGHDWEVLVAHPVRSLIWKRASEMESFKVSNLGLVGQMTGAAALLRQDMSMNGEKGLRITATLKALGTWGVWISIMKDLSLKDNFFALIAGTAVPFECVSKDDDGGSRKGRGNVIYVDLEKAWKMLGLEPDWNNDLEVEMFINP